MRLAHKFVYPAIINFSQFRPITCTAQFSATMAFTSPSTSTSCPAAPTPPPPLSAQSVIIVGSGLAGLAAASQLVAHKVPVHMLDRAPKPGGNSIKASSGINGVPTRFQPLKDDTPGLFFNDTINSAGGVLLLRSSSDQVLLREQLIRTLTSSAGSAVNWLVDENGIDLSRVVQLGGHSRPRTHRGAGEKPPGVAIVSTLLGLLEKNPLFKLQTDATVTKVLREDEEVLGVEYTCEGDSSTTATKTEEKLHGPVIFASGGFAGDAHGLLAKYRPDLAGVPTTNQAREGSQPLLTDIGAGLLDMESVQVHPTGFIDPKDPAAQVKFLAAEALRGEGAIMLLENGTRFVNELETRKNVTDAIMRSAATTTPENTRQWPVNLVLDEGAAEAASSHLGFYTWKGLVRKTTVSELGTSALQTIQDYADIVSGRKTDEYHRTSFGSWTLTDVRPDSVMYVGQVTPVVHFTMGGVTINERSEVLDMDMKQIRGLWAAGEVAGGVHGQNRLGGSSLLECVVFGRIAGDQAAKFYQEHYATRLDDL